MPLRTRTFSTSDPQEQAELDTFELLGCLLSILHSKARQAQRAALIAEGVFPPAT